MTRGRWRGSGSHRGRWVVVLGRAGALALALALLAGPVDSNRRSVDAFDAVVVDAGHGGEDEGALGVSGLTEKDLVLDVSKRLARRLRAAGIRVVLTREDDTFVPLEQRTSIANDARADLFVSIHANAAHTDGPRGVETYFVSLEASDDSANQVAARENSAFGETAAGRSPGDPLLALLGDMITGEYVDESSDFSKLAQHQLADRTPLPSRGVKQAPFVVLMGVQMPASLIEIGFLTNATDETQLRKSATRDDLADAVARAVTEFGKRYDARRGVTGILSRPAAGASLR